MMSFEALQQRFSLPASERYRYIQISQMLKKSPQIFTHIPVQMTKFFLHPSTKPKGISILYKGLQEKDTLVKEHNIITWERDFGVSYSAQSWAKSIRILTASTRSTNLLEMHQKLLLRWYLTPHRLAKMFPNANATCWRQCGERGTLFHIMWECPNIRALWSQVEGVLAGVSDSFPPLHPAMAILSMGIDAIPKSQTMVVSHILLATRLVILRHWKNINPPTMAEIINTVHTHSTYEILHASALGKYEKINNLWAPWHIRHSSK